MVGGADEVAVPAITWNATPNAAQFAGCDVHIMPVDENTGLGLVAMIDDECDTVIGVDLYGQLSDEPAEDVAWIVDAAHSFEADIRRQARVTCFSFHTLKALPIGVGGAALFQTSIDADEARLLRWQGVDTDRIQKTVGMKATMPAFAAAMGISMLRGLNDREAVRRSVVNRYEELIDPDLLMEVRYADDCHDCCHAFVVKVANRHELRRELDAVGIGTAFYYPSLRSHPHWRSSKGVGKQVHFGEQLIALPCHSQMDEEHVEYVATHVNNLAVRTP
jgi:perosamine synthetase